MKTLLKKIIKKTRTSIADPLFAKLGYERSKAYFHNNIFGHTMFSNPKDLGINLSGYNNVPIERVNDKGEIGFILSNLREGATAIDVGANIGFFTLLMARAVGENGKVLAVEPGPMSYALLNKNLQINRYKNVSLYNIAISNEARTTEFFLCRTGESDNRLFATPSEARDVVSIDVNTIDSIAENMKVDLVKIDIQGSELLALQGMKKVIKNNPHIKILMEYSPDCLIDCGSKPEDLFRTITELGFDIYECPHNRSIHKTTSKILLEEIGHEKLRPSTNIVLIKA
jgi:FkbM family methyltransferase